jgi:hypothetical protein
VIGLDAATKVQRQDMKTDTCLTPQHQYRLHHDSLFFELSLNGD